MTFKSRLLFAALLTTIVPLMALFPLATGNTSAAAISASGEVRSDFNGDGKADLAIGVPGEGFGNLYSSGAVNVLYGGPSGLQTSSPADQFWHQNSPGVEDAAENEDNFGGSLA